MEIETLLQLEKKYYPNEEIGPISVARNDFVMYRDYKAKLIEYSITEAEYIAVILMRHKDGNILQDHLVGKCESNELRETLNSLMDNVLKKLPNSNHTILFRQDCYGDINTYKIRDTINVDYYLTASRRLLSVRNPKITWEITPLPSNQTKAKCLYEISELLGTPPEWQVNFERGTRFIVDEIDYSGSVPIMHVHEV